MTLTTTKTAGALRLVPAARRSRHAWPQSDAEGPAASAARKRGAHVPHGSAGPRQAVNARPPVPTSTERLPLSA